MKDEIAKALYRKATGYTAEEVVEEYNGDEGELVKRKVSKKHVPPDMVAIKAYMEIKEKNDELSAISDTELEEIKTRLVGELANSKKEKKDENSKTTNKSKM